MKNNNYIRHVLYLRNNIAYDQDFWLKKLAQDDKKLCLLCLISQEPYIWFWFVVLMGKMIISPRVFFIFSKIWFSGLEGKRAKNSPKWQKIVSDISWYQSCLISQEPYIIWLSFVIHKCKMIMSAGIFFISKFWC